LNLILASSNKGKIKELKTLLPLFKIIPYSEILGHIDINETGSSFKQNAIIKVKAVLDALAKISYQEKFLVISDDSGITVPVLNNEPNIYSARYAGLNATDKQNNEKLILKLNQKNITTTKAFYTACLAIGYQDKIYTTHGWMYGDVINKQIGDGGFGYDSLFIPNDFTKTLGQLDTTVKKELSHRTKALKIALKIIKVILK